VAGIADLLYLGSPDPARQLALALQGQQPGGAPPQGAAPGAAPPQPGAAAADPNAPAPNPSPGDPAPPNAGPQPQSLQSPPQLAQSYQTLANPPNLMSLYIQMQQRDQAMRGINSGLALIAANHSPPSMRQSIMQSLTGGQDDAGGMVNNLMSLYQAQTQMGAQRDLLGQSPDIAARLNLPENVVRDMILQGKGPDLIAKMEPTDQQRNIQAEHDQFIKGGGSEEDWQKYYLPMVITGGIPGMTGDMKSMALARTQWQADPANRDRPLPTYLTDPTKWSLFQKDLIDAKGQFNGMNQSLGNFVDDLGAVSSNPKLDEITGSAKAVGKGWLEGLAPGSDAYNLHTKMEGLGNTGKVLAARGGPKGVGQNLAGLGANPEDYTNFGIGNYREEVLVPKIKTALVAQANSFGAAGRLGDLPGYLRPYLDQMYQPGGDLDPGGPIGKTVQPNKDLKQLSEQDKRDFQNAVEHYGPRAALKHLKDNGYDTSALE
jgi:hypothetical protein